MKQSSKRAGNYGEDIAAMQLRAMGVQMVETIHTGWKVLKWVNKHRRVAVVVPFARVMGDRRGILPNGRSVLVEVKTDDNDTLPYSRLKSHQASALCEHHDNGGLSLLVWVNRGDVYVMKWPIPDFVPRKSIHYLDARRYEWGGFSLNA